MLAQKHDGAPEISAFGEAVDPRDGIGPVGARLERLHGRGEIGRGKAALADPAALDGLQAQGGAQDDPRQSHASNRPGEQIRVLLARTAADFTVGPDNVDPLDEAAERSVLVVVLAVHVGRDRAAQRDEFRPGRDREKPAARQKGLDDLAQRHARFRDQDARVRIE